MARESVAKVMRFRAQYDAVADKAAREHTDICCMDESKTQQQFAEDADINVMMRRFGVAEMQLPPMAHDPKFYGDMSDIPDLRTALERVRDAEEKFMALEPALRARFHNSPALLYEFVMDERNMDEAKRLGLLAPEAVASSPPGGGS